MQGKSNSFDFMTVREVADLFKMSQKHIYRLTAVKEIPYYRLGSGRKGIRFDKSEIEQWIANKKEVPLAIPEIKF